MVAIKRRPAMGPSPSQVAREPVVSRGAASKARADLTDRA